MNSSASNESTPPSIPDHEVLRCIGRGSFGLVWLARNRMGTYRAVKVVSRRAFDNPKPYERELAGIRRFEPVSRLHEGFVDILHVGMNDAEEYFYYIMELGDDQTQGQIIDPDSYSPKTLSREISLRGKLFLQECVQLGLGLSGALGELHSRDLVHRDIKPANIIYVSGVPKLADAGLVADAKDAPTYAGTRGFIPPEGPGTPQADIYSLGKVLYEAATGKDREEFPELPPIPADPVESKRLLDLNEIILEACQNDTRLRYKSAWDIHSDLQMIADNVSLREVKVLRRRVAQLKRAALVSVLALSVGGGIGYLGYRELQNRIEARDREITGNIIKAERAQDGGNYEASVSYFVAALRLEEGLTNRATADRLRLGSVLAQSPKLTHCWLQNAVADDGEFSPDGTKIVIASFSGQTKVYDLLADNLCLRFGSSTNAVSAAFGPDARTMVTASRNNACSVWNIADTNHITSTTWIQPGLLSNARFNRDGKRIVVATEDGVARVLDVKTGALEREFAQSGELRFADFSHDGRMILTASVNGTAQIWNADTGQPIGPPLQHGRGNASNVWIYYAAFSPNDKLVVTAGFDRTAKVWEVGSSKQVGPAMYHRQPVLSAEFSPDGRWILTASLDGAARLWRASDLKPVDGNSVMDRGDPLSRATFSPDCRLILTVGRHGSVCIWDLAGSALRPLRTPLVFDSRGTRSVAGETNGSMEVRDLLSGSLVSVCTNAGTPLNKVQFSQNGRFVLSTARVERKGTPITNLVQVWDADHGKLMGPSLSFPGPLTGTELSDDGRRVLVFYRQLAQIWDVVSGRSLTAPLVHPAKVTMAKFSPDSTRLAIASGKDVILRDALSGEAISQALPHLVAVKYLDFSPNGKWLATCCQDDDVTKCYGQVWDTATGRAEGERLWHSDGVLFVSFSADSSRLITAGEDFMAMIWDFRTGKQIGSTLEHNDQVKMATFSPDGAWVVTASDDQTARVWDARTGHPLTPPLRHLAQLRSARFLADGYRIVTTDADDHSWIWDLPIDSHSMKDLGTIARILAGDALNPRARTDESGPESLDRMWMSIPKNLRNDFSTTREQIDAWHESQAEESEAEQDWFAAAFHLRILVDMRPADVDLKRRLTRAEAMKAAHDGTQPESSLR